MQGTTKINAAAEEVFARHKFQARSFLAHKAVLNLSTVERVQVTVADGAVESAMPVVRTRLCDGDELPTVRAAEFR